MSSWIDNLLYKMRKRRFCKLNGWFCPDCIYHDFVFEGTIFRGNKCRYPAEEETKGEKMIRQESNINANNETNITIYEGGMKVKDTMTGVEGTITAWCHYYGMETDQVRITIKAENGVIIEDWVSVSRLAVVE